MPEFSWHHMEEKIQRLRVTEWICHMEFVSCILWEYPEDTSFAKVLKGAPPSLKSSLVTLPCRPGIAVRDTIEMGSLISAGMMWSRQGEHISHMGQQGPDLLVCRGLQKLVIDHSISTNEIDRQPTLVLLNLFPCW